MHWTHWIGAHGASWLGLGLDAHQLDSGQAVLRAAIVYLGGLILIRFGTKRLLGRSTAFDLIVSVIVGSLLSRAVNGGAPLLPTLAATAALVALHWGIGFLSHEVAAFDRLFNGTVTPLIVDGRPDHRAMRFAAVSHRDIAEAARLSVGTGDLDELAEVNLERNGRFSIRRRDVPRVLEVKVEEGVQTIRLQVG